MPAWTDRTRKAAEIVGVIGFLLIALYVYFYPGSQALLDGRTDTVMSDGSDPASLPYTYDLAKKLWQDHPSRYFYGSLYIDGIDPVHGISLWVSWMERWLGLLYSYLVPIEQVSTAFTLTIVAFNFLAMYILGLILGWRISVRLPLSLAWAICAYTRARAKVHPALAGTFHVPLIFLGLYLVFKGKSWRSLALSAVAFLIAASGAHYYLVTSIFLSPFFLLFLFLQPETRVRFKPILLRLITAIVPAMILLGWSFFMATPPGAKITSEESKNYGVLEQYDVHPFMNIFCAHPVDYLAGDISLEQNGVDWNPLRDVINSSILSNLGDSNPHERTNGIRWTILIIALLAVAHLAFKCKDFSGAEKRNLLFFLGFAAFTFWLSLAPDIPALGWSPSYWQAKIFPRVRVPSRAGVWTHFSLLMIVGIYLHHSTNWLRYLTLPGALLALVVLDYPPIQKMPMAPVLPAYEALNRSHGACGTGMAFPFTNPQYTSVAHYYFAQRMRGSDCPNLNSLQEPENILAITKYFPPSPQYLQALSYRKEEVEKLESFARCIPLSWIVFQEGTPVPFAVEVCKRLGFNLSSDGVCRGTDSNSPTIQSPQNCLRP
ncbi:MAG: hypothetical protein AB7F86_15035 [Bdellovibrionales bacterium]